MPLIRSSKNCIPGSKHQDPPSRTRLRAVEHARESSRPIKCEKSAERQYLRLREGDAVHRITQGNRSPAEGSCWRVEPDRMKPVAEKQMLFIIARDDPIEAAKLLRIEPVS